MFDQSNLLLKIYSASAIWRRKKGYRDHDSVRWAQNNNNNNTFAIYIILCFQCAIIAIKHTYSVAGCR